MNIKMNQGNILKLDDLPFEASLLSCQFRISKIRGSMGRYDPRKHTIFIRPEYITDKTVILHEMIHAYEGILLQEHDALRQILRDNLTFSLYNCLRPKINDLNEKILHHSHIVAQEQITKIGGLHSILFYLKSLDLDLRLDLKLGEIYGYDR